jgi:hypothetical protein
VHDLAFSKLAAGRRKDMEFVGNLLRHKLIKQARLKLMIEQEQKAEIKPLLMQRFAVVISSLRVVTGIRP